MSGRAFVFGDNIDTDVMAPGTLMKLPPDELAQHCLAAVDPDFARTVAKGDFVVGGRSFGIGSSREQAAVLFNLAAMRGSVEAKLYRKELSQEMASEDVAEAQRQAREWLAHG